MIGVKKILCNFSAFHFIKARLRAEGRKKESNLRCAMVHQLLLHQQKPRGTNNLSPHSK